jgi:hypothetical protein
LGYQIEIGTGSELDGSNFLVIELGVKVKIKVQEFKLRWELLLEVLGRHENRV